MDAYLSMLERETAPLPFKNVLITGPFMPKHQRSRIFKRARRLGIRTYHFYRNMEKLLAAADVAVSMGGYNTLCELLSIGTTALIIPRETPRKEQLIRARILHSRHLVDYVPWSQCSPDLLHRKVWALLDNSEHYRRAIANFQMTGIDEMRKRLIAFCNRDTFEPIPATCRHTAV
jgi:predicted glycosyltransferase